MCLPQPQEKGLCNTIGKEILKNSKKSPIMSLEGYFLTPTLILQHLLLSVFYIFKSKATIKYYHTFLKIKLIVFKNTKH